LSPKAAIFSEHWGGLGGPGDGSFPVGFKGRAPNEGLGAKPSKTEHFLLKG